MEFDFTYSPEVDGFTLFDIDAKAKVDVSEEGIIEVKCIWFEAMGEWKIGNPSGCERKDIDCPSFMVLPMSEYLVANYEDEIIEQWGSIYGY